MTAGEMSGFQWISRILVLAQVSKAELRVVTAGIWKISQRDLVGFTIPVPPIEEQYELVARIDELFTLADQVEARYAKAKQYVDNLKQAILAKAFLGELVPHDPNDEPASVLLEKIREARANQEPPRSRRRVTPSTPPSGSPSFLIKGQCSACGEPLSGIMSIVQYSDYYLCESHWGTYICPKCYGVGTKSCPKCGGPLSFHSGAETIKHQRKRRFLY
jgi:hypothetical protein